VVLQLAFEIGGVGSRQIAIERIGEEMDAARQALRFSIPGSVLVLMTLGLVIGELAFLEIPPRTVTEPVQENVAALVGILSVIPIGFMTYQVYYLGVRPFVWLRPRGIQKRRRPRIDRGAAVLRVFSDSELDSVRDLYDLFKFGAKDDPRREVDLVNEIDDPVERENERDDLALRERRILDADIPGTISVARQDRLDASRWLKKLLRRLGGTLGVRELSPEFIHRWPFNEGSPTPVEEWERAKEFYELRWRTNWDVVVALVEAAAAYPDTGSIKGEYTILTDLYHALGACRTACALAFWISSVSIGIYTLTAHANAAKGLGAIGLGLIFCVSLWLLLNYSRHQTWRAAAQMMRHGFRRLIKRHPEFLASVPIDQQSGRERSWRSRIAESVKAGVRSAKESFYD
jgi:hypothetical protein